MHEHIGFNANIERLRYMLSCMCTATHCVHNKHVVDLLIAESRLDAVEQLGLKSYGIGGVHQFRMQVDLYRQKMRDDRNAAAARAGMTKMNLGKIAYVQPLQDGRTGRVVEPK